MKIRADTADPKKMLGPLSSASPFTTKGGVPSTSPRRGTQHPLLQDAGHWEHVLDLMWYAIHRELGWRRSARRGAHDERIIDSSGVSARDILSLAMEGLLAYNPDPPPKSWERVAVRFAINKTVDAIRHSQKGLGATLHRARLRVVSGDQPHWDSVVDEPHADSILDSCADPATNPEECISAQQSLDQVRRLAHEILDERERRIYFDVQSGIARKEIGEALELTGQRVGQIFIAALKKLTSHSEYPYPSS